MTATMIDRPTKAKTTVENKTIENTTANSTAKIMASTVPTKKTTMNINEIRSFLPHRYPFLFIDRIIDVVAGEYVIATKNITINEPVFDGHFPGNPIFPGVYIIEAMAQAAGILGFKTLGGGAQPNKAYLMAGVDNVRFKRASTPGDQLVIRAEIINQKRTIWKFKTEARVDGELICSAEILCAEKELDD